jgi:uncharacterized repeat protein (TIGR01451 family)
MSMNRNWSEAFAPRGRALWQWIAAVFVAATSVGVAPAFAGNASMALSVSQSPSLAVFGGSATYTATLTNVSNNTINNVSLAIAAPTGAAISPPTAGCVLSTGLPCTLSGPSTASGYQLPRNGTLTLSVSYYMPAVATPLPTFTLNVTGTSSNNSGGPNPAAYTTIATSYNTVFAPPPPVYPNIAVTISHDPGNTVLWSTAACTGSPSDDPDCGASYYGEYTVTVKNLGSAPIVGSTQPFAVDVSSALGAFADSFGCAAPCAPGSSSTNFVIAGLSASGAPDGSDSTSFTVLFKSPMQSPPGSGLPTSFDVTATATVGPLFTPAIAALSPAPSGSLTTALTDAALQTYSSLVPSTGGSSKAKNFALPGTKGPFSSRVDVPKYTKGNAPVNIVIQLTPETTSCSPSSPECLDSQVDVQSGGTPVDFGGTSLPLPPLNGTDFLVINMVRDWTTLNKKPSSVFNAVVLYSDPSRGITRELIKDCANVDLTAVERCIFQRIDMTTSAKGVVTGGYIKFIIWARHNGVYSW